MGRQKNRSECMTALKPLFAGMAMALIGTSAIAQTAELSTPTETAEPDAQLLGGVAAVVNDEVISLSDVAQRARLLLITLGVPASDENVQQVLSRALEDLIDERLQLQKAAEYDVEISPEEIDASVFDIAAQNGSTLEELYASLGQSGIGPETLQEQMRAEI